MAQSMAQERVVRCLAGCPAELPAEYSMARRFEKQISKPGTQVEPV
jgi:hypothetical protein